METTTARLIFDAEDLMAISTVPGEKPVLMTMSFKIRFYEEGADEQTALIQVYEDYMLYMEHRSQPATMPSLYTAPSFFGNYKVYEEEHVVIFMAADQLGELFEQPAEA